MQPHAIHFNRVNAFLYVWLHIYAMLMYARTYICVMVTSLFHLQGRQEFQPWGNCFDNSLWIHHFQKDPALMQRRYERAAAGKSICGEGTEIGLQFLFNRLILSF